MSTFLQYEFQLLGPLWDTLECLRLDHKEADPEDWPWDGGSDAPGNQVGLLLNIAWEEQLSNDCQDIKKTLQYIQIPEGSFTTQRPQLALLAALFSQTCSESSKLSRCLISTFSNVVLKNHHLCHSYSPFFLLLGRTSHNLSLIRATGMRRRWSTSPTRRCLKRYWQLFRETSTLPRWKAGSCRRCPGWWPTSWSVWTTGRDWFGSVWYGWIGIGLRLYYILEWSDKIGRNMSELDVVAICFNLRLQVPLLLQLVARRC